MNVPSFSRARRIGGRKIALAEKRRANRATRRVARKLLALGQDPQNLRIRADAWAVF